MEVLIPLLLLTNVMLAILLVVVRMARMDRTYAEQVRREYDHKSLLRGDDDR